jgi:hypothetical protein
VGEKDSIGNTPKKSGEIKERSIGLFNSNVESERCGLIKLLLLLASLPLFRLGRLSPDGILQQTIISCRKETTNISNIYDYNKSLITSR